MRSSRVIVFLLSLVHANTSTSGYYQKLDDLSFDMSMAHEYPQSWVTTGSAVPLLSKVKILPLAAQLNGQAFLKSKLQTPSWEISYRMRLNQNNALHRL